MKKILIIIGFVFAFIILLALILPVIFKDEIKAKVDQEIAKSVDAKVYFDADKFSLGLFRNFPNITVSMEDFGIVNNEPFKGDTLMAVDNFKLVLNLRSVLFGDKIKIKGIQLDKPYINVKVLADGTANYDIMISDTTAVDETDTTATEFSIGIDSWEINDGLVVYDDKSLGVYTKIAGLNHSGSGDFTQDIFDLSTNTVVDGFTLAYEGAEYMSNKKLDVNMTLNMNLPESKYTFKDNTVKVNDFAFGFDGFVAMPSDDINMDITFASKENTFKSLLSLIPGMYTKDFESVKTEGNLQFSGAAKGTYNDSLGKMPAFNLKLLVNDAMFKYPDLPTAVSNINVDMAIDNKDGVIDNTVVDIRKFHMDMGQNPVDAKVLIAGLGKMTIDANVLAKINLADFSSMIPMEGLVLKGIFDMNLKAKGVYDSVTSQMPAIDAAMKFQNGYVKSVEFPAALENINVVSTVKNTSGNMAETVVEVPDFSFLLDGEKMSGSLHLENFNDYTWDLAAAGAIDLEKMAKVLDLKDMTLAGRIIADIKTKGKMSAVDAERYDQLPTSGTMSIKNFKYSSADLPQGFTIASADATFNPDKIVINSFNGAAGRSDMKIDGNVTNYMGFLFRENETIKGSMNFSSNKFDVNEWMTDDATPTDTAASEPLTVIEIPKNIDFVLKSSINQVLYDNLTLSNVVGNLIVKDGTVKMENLAFNTLGGQFVMNGIYDSKDVTKPAFDFDIKIKDLSISSAYQNFNTIKAMVPIAEKVNGKFSTDFKLAGRLGQDMMPVYSTLLGGGLIEVADAALKDSKIISGVTSLTKMNKTDEVNLKDLKINAEVKDGRVHVKPFDINLGNAKTVVQGSNGIDGSLDYIMKMDIPAGALGTSINNAIASLSGGSSSSSNFKVNLKVGGTYADPKIGLAGGESGSGPATQAQDAVKQQVSAEVDKVKEDLSQQKKEAEEKARQEIEQKKQEAEQKAKEEQERLRKEAEERAKKEAEKVKEKAKDKVRDIFGK